VYNKNIGVCVYVCVCVNCAKYKELPSQAAELVWGTRAWHSHSEAARELLAHGLPTPLLRPFGGPDIPVISVSADLSGGYGLYCIPQSESPWLPNATDNQEV